jgi:septum formation protein
MSKLVLASTSPRRKRLLEHLGLDFIVVGTHVVEEVSKSDSEPSDTAERLALEKANEASASYPDKLVLGADTIVLIDDTLLGKPGDFSEAEEMLRQLSGRRHTVITGLALVHRATSRTVVTHERTTVEFMNLDAQEIRDYVRTGSPMDKAGAYGIQDDRGALFVSGIVGDFYNVMGLPLNRLYVTVRTHFAELDIFGFSDATA